MVLRDRKSGRRRPRECADMGEPACASRPGAARRRRDVSWAVAGLTAVFVLTLLGWQYYVRTTGKSGSAELLDAKEYRRHYVIIPDDYTSPMWQDIFQSARAAAEGYDAYVELLGGWEAGDYTPLSYMDIAIASRVDGIIVKPDGTAKMRSAIDAADGAGIPVITVINDDTASSRKSFVGFNNYQLGAAYGQEILRCVDESTRKITVLFKRGNSGNELIFRNLKMVIEEGLSGQQRKDVEIQSLTMTAQSTFDAEEVIRDLLKDDGTRPDILVCMNETDSESAYNAMVDYNQVGNVDIIGYYQSETILDAIEKGIIPMALTLDTGQMGRSSIEALEEYYTMGYTSSYMSVDLSVITSENVEDYRGTQER